MVVEIRAVVAMQLEEQKFEIISTSHSITYHIKNVLIRGPLPFRDRTRRHPAEVTRGPVVHLRIERVCPFWAIAASQDEDCRCDFRHLFKVAVMG